MITQFIKDISQLVKLAMRVKFSIGKCLKLDDGTDEHRLASHYKKALNKLEDGKKMTAAEIDAMIEILAAQQDEFSESQPLVDMLSAISALLSQLKIVKERY
jgi:hypothetical protein